MNSDAEQTHVSPVSRNPFWACLAVFLVLAVANVLRLTELSQQCGQLNELRLNQVREVTQLGPVWAQQSQLEAKLQAYSMDLLQLATTNAASRQIVQEFKIQWLPGSTVASASIPTNPPSGK